MNVQILKLGTTDNEQRCCFFSKLKFYFRLRVSTETAFATTTTTAATAITTAANTAATTTNATTATA